MKRGLIIAYVFAAVACTVNFFAYVWLRLSGILEHPHNASTAGWLGFGFFLLMCVALESLEEIAQKMSHTNNEDKLPDAD